MYSSLNIVPNPVYDFWAWTGVNTGGGSFAYGVKILLIFFEVKEKEGLMTAGGRGYVSWSRGVLSLSL